MESITSLIKDLKLNIVYFIDEINKRGIWSGDPYYGIIGSSRESEFNKKIRLLQDDTILVKQKLYLLAIGDIQMTARDRLICNIDNIAGLLEDFKKTVNDFLQQRLNIGDPEVKAYFDDINQVQLYKRFKHLDDALDGLCRIYNTTSVPQIQNNFYFNDATISNSNVGNSGNSVNQISVNSNLYSEVERILLDNKESPEESAKILRECQKLSEALQVNKSKLDAIQSKIQNFLLFIGKSVISTAAKIAIELCLESIKQKFGL